MNLEALLKLPGFENFQEQKPSRAFVKILQGKAATEAKVVPGTVIRTDSDEVLCEVGGQLKFVPLYFDFRYVILDEDNNIIDMLNNGATKWQSGREVQPEDLNWINGQPPKANKALDLLILPATEMAKEVKTPAILSIIATNAQRAKIINEIMQLFKVTTLEQKLNGLFQASYTLSVETFASGKHEWLDWAKPTFYAVIKKETFELCSKLYKETKGLLSPKALEASHVELIEAPKEEEAPQKKERSRVKKEAVEAEVVEEVKETTIAVEKKITVEVAEDLDF